MVELSQANENEEKTYALQRVASMKKKNGWGLLLILTIILFCGCGAESSVLEEEYNKLLAENEALQSQIAAQNDKETESEPPVETETETEVKETEPEEETEKYEGTTLPDNLPYVFFDLADPPMMTEWHIRSDGRFAGQVSYQTAENGANYPNGTEYRSFVSGTVTDVKSNGKNYVFRIDNMEYEKPIGEEWIEDRSRIVEIEIPGIRENVVYTMYPPGALVEDEELKALWEKTNEEFGIQENKKLETYVICPRELDTPVMFRDTGFSAQNDLILPDAFQRFLTDDDISRLRLYYPDGIIGRDVCQIVINEIYARYGYAFSKEDLDQYFRHKYWYWDLAEDGRLTDDMAKVESFLIKLEKDNVKFLRNAQGQNTNTAQEAAPVPENTTPTTPETPAPQEEAPAPAESGLTEDQMKQMTAFAVLAIHDVWETGVTFFDNHFEGDRMITIFTAPGPLGIMEHKLIVFWQGDGPRCELEY